MAGRASIVGAAETSVGKVRDHNEDSHFIDPEAGIFVVCDGMGGHAAGEVASALAVQTVRKTWSSDSTQQVCDRWLVQGTPEARKELLQTITAGVLAAHDAIVAEAEEDRAKKGMGTTLVGAMIVGGDVVFAHAGDSRAYLVRDGIAMQLTEDHTLLARLLAAGVDVDTEGEGMRFKSMLTNALGIGHECKVSTFVVPVADGDRFLLCSDGITEYIKEAEIGEVLSTQPSPARSAQRLVELALQRGGGDNATALVVRILEAGETARPSVHVKREERAIYACPIWGKANPQQRLRALRIALPRDYAAGEKLPAQTLGDRVAWIIVEGELEQDGHLRGPGSLLYPEALLTDRPLPDKDGLAVAQSEVRGLALRSDDFRELCDDDPELGEILLSALAAEITARRPQRRTGKIVIPADAPNQSGEIARADTGQMQPLSIDSALPTGVLRAPAEPGLAIDSALPSGVLRAPAEPGLALGRANTADMDVAHASTARLPAVVDDEEEAKPEQETRSEDETKPEPHARQRISSTVPPGSVRARSTTDVGAPVADRTPAPPDRPSAPRMARHTTPPTGLIVSEAQRAETEAALDAAMAQISGEHPVPPISAPAPSSTMPGMPAMPAMPKLPPMRSMPPVPSMPPVKPTVRIPPVPPPPIRAASNAELDDDSEPEMIVEGATAAEPLPPPPPVSKSPPPLSEPEIQIERLAAQANASTDDDAEEPIVMTMTVDDDSAPIVSMTADEPPEPEITVEPLEPDEPRAKSEH